MASQGATDVSLNVAVEPSNYVTFYKGENISKLQIYNRSQLKNVVFKIRTTQPLCYVVKPNSGIIEANNSCNIEINYVPNEQVNNVQDSKF